MTDVLGKQTARPGRMAGGEFPASYLRRRTARAVADRPRMARSPIPATVVVGTIPEHELA